MRCYMYFYVNSTIRRTYVWVLPYSLVVVQHVQLDVDVSVSRDLEAAQLDVLRQLPRHDEDRSVQTQCLLQTTCQIWQTTEILPERRRATLIIYNYCTCTCTCMYKLQPIASLTNQRMSSLSLPSSTASISSWHLRWISGCSAKEYSVHAMPLDVVS